MKKTGIITLILVFLTACFIFALNQDNPNQLIGSFLKNAKNISFSADMDNDTGSVRNMRVKFSEGLLGAFKHHKTGLKIKNADIEARDIRIVRDASDNLDVQASSVGAVYLHSLEIKEADLTVFAASVYSKFTDISVKISNNRIALSGRYSGMKFEAVAVVYKPKNSVRDIGLKFEGLKAGRVRVPDRLTGLLTKGDGLLMKNLKLRVKLYYNEISAQNGVLKIR